MHHSAKAQRFLWEFWDISCCQAIISGRAGAETERPQDAANEITKNQFSRLMVSRIGRSSKVEIKWGFRTGSCEKLYIQYLQLTSSLQTSAETILENCVSCIMASPTVKMNRFMVCIVASLGLLGLTFAQFTKSETQTFKVLYYPTKGKSGHLQHTYANQFVLIL